MPTTALCVAAGGLAGVMLRYGLTVCVQSIWTLLGINLAGSFLLGVLVHIGVHLSQPLRNGLAIGFLGGFTTLSTLTVQTVMEADGGRPGRAAVYFLLNVLGGLVCAALGYMIGRPAV